MIENRPNRISNTGTVLTFQTSSVVGLAGTTTLFADATGVLSYRIGTGAVQQITGSSVWGSITGTLSAQSDLNTALGLKADASALSSYLTTANAASTYQPILVSGTNLKTINGVTLLGNTNIVAGDATLAGTQTFTGVNTFSQNILGSAKVILGGATTTTALRLDLSSNSTSYAQSNALLAARNASSGNDIEWGHQSQNGFVSVLGHNTGLGTPFIGFGVESGTNSDTYRTRSSTVGIVIRGRTDGILQFGHVTALGTDNQSLTERMQISAGGRLLLGSTTDNGTDILQVTGTSKFTGNVTVAGDILPSDNTKNLGGSTRWASLQMNGGINFYGGTTYNIKPESFSTPSGVAFAATIQTANASAIVDIQSTTKGFLPPRQTQTQRTAISSPAVGLIVYQTDATEGLYVYKSGGWTFII